MVALKFPEMLLMELMRSELKPLKMSAYQIGNEKKRRPSHTRELRKQGMLGRANSLSEAKQAELIERMAEHEHVRQIQIREDSERLVGKSG